MRTTLTRTLPEGLETLAELALDLRWMWSHSGDALWRELDAQAWKRTSNPCYILQNVPQDRLDALARSATFGTELARLLAERQAYLEGPTWCADEAPGLVGETVAYFSMEFGLGEALPLYAGGLGILAGDYLKTASDLGLPVVGVGILFQEGYFRQTIDIDGRQRETYPYNDPSFLPVQPASAQKGGWLRVSLDLPGRTLWLRVWRARIGRTDLYLLDANDPVNSPRDRGITTRLYGGDQEMRLLQEMVLGIGGWKALVALGIEAGVAHLNEGHAALAVVERARQLMRRQRLSFDEALWATRAGNLFTTHTPVAAGFDVFDPRLFATYFPPFGPYVGEAGIPLDRLMALGRRDPRDAAEPVNMAYVALRGCARINGVSRLHGEVSRQLFAPLFPRWPLAEVPVDHVTNGVHVPSWDSPEADALWTRAGGKGRWRGSVEAIGDVVGTLADADLWEMRAAERARLVDQARERLAVHLAQRGAGPEAVAGATQVLDPNVLTLGFARRFAEYKRPTLLLQDPERFARILLDARRPVQIVVAGKAHPADEHGKGMIAEWVAFVARPDVRRRAVFLEDYDMVLAEHLVEGVDVWINTPRRPWEACGTSGMKVLANGGLNLSETDGWWAEASSPEVGWALEAGRDDATALYELLEREVVPEFYDRGPDGIPARWVERIRASMSRLAPQFSSNRMAREYAQLYEPAVAEYRLRTAGGAGRARELALWERELSKRWGEIHFGPVTKAEVDGQTELRVDAYLGGLAPEAVQVELYTERPAGAEACCVVMDDLAPLSGATHGRVYVARTPPGRVAEDYTPRVVPRRDAVRIPAELPLILWQR